MAFKALSRLHTFSICHGDARMDNAVVVNGVLKWIDFRGLHILQPQIQCVFRNDMTSLVRSLLTEKQKNEFLGTESPIDSDLDQYRVEWNADRKQSDKSVHPVI